QRPDRHAQGQDLALHGRADVGPPFAFPSEPNTGENRMDQELTALVERLDAAITAMDLTAWDTAWKETDLGPLDQARAALACDPLLATDRTFQRQIVWETRGLAQRLLDVASRH